jgi:hypothetical protein
MNLAMRGSAAGVSYSLWLRLRWVLGGILIYIAALAITVHLVSSALIIASVGVLALSSVAAHVVTVLTLGPSDIAARGSGFPRIMLVLPMRTSALVGWPMLFGVIGVALMWVLVVVLVLRPAGLMTPIIWPAALSAAAMAWVQAMGWTPFPSPFARVPALALAMTPLILLGCFAGLFLESHLVAATIVVSSLLWTFAAYAFAVQGLARARAGSDGDWVRALLASVGARLQKHRRAADDVRRRFRSDFSAQLWHECRCNAIALPVMLTFVGLPMIALILPTVINDNRGKGLMIGSQYVSPSQLGLGFLVGMFLLFSGLYGPSLGKFNIWGKEEMSAFFAIRPMTTARFVFVKMIAAALGALIAWTIMLALIAVWAVVEASPLNPNESLVLAAAAYVSPRTIAMCIAIMLGLLAFAWREIAIGMWITLTGRKWLATLLSLLMMAIFSLTAIIGTWVYKQPEIQPRLFAATPWLIGASLVAKLCSAAFVFAALHKQRSIPPSAMIWWLGAWCLAAVGLCGLLALWVPPSPMLAACVLLLLPLTRVAAAPLALHWNRHR